MTEAEAQRREEIYNEIKKQQQDQENTQNINKSQAQYVTNFSYLSIFEEQTRAKREALNEFYKQADNENDGLEQMKPAMFRQDQRAQQ
jgi:hypothetical protein